MAAPTYPLDGTADRGPRAVLVPHRDVTLDAVRGAAIVLMILDHALGFAQTTDLTQPWMHDIRFSITRLAMPAFMVCSGMLLSRRGIARRRWFEVAAVAVAVNGAALISGLSTFVPDILAIWCLVMLLATPLRRFPATIAVLGLLQATYWRLPIAGYQPGWVLAFVALGVLMARSGDQEVLPAIARRTPAWATAIGRKPLRWYAGHLACLAAATSIGAQLGWW